MVAAASVPAASVGDPAQPRPLGGARRQLRGHQVAAAACTATAATAAPAPAPAPADPRRRRVREEQRRHSARISTRPGTMNASAADHAPPRGRGPARRRRSPAGSMPGRGAGCRRRLASSKSASVEPASAAPRTARAAARCGVGGPPKPRQPIRPQSLWPPLRACERRLVAVLRAGGHDAGRAAGWKSSIGLPDGSSSRTC